jgi:hypothetical protein
VLVRRTSAIQHDTVKKLLDFLDATPGVVLVLVLRFRLHGTHIEEAKDLFDFLSDSHSCVITHETIRGTVAADKILKSARHLVFGMHGERTSDLAVFATVDSAHSSTTMSHNTVVVCRFVRKQPVGSHNFIQT